MSETTTRTDSDSYQPTEPDGSSTPTAAEVKQTQVVATLASPASIPSEEVISYDNSKDGLSEFSKYLISAVIVLGGVALVWGLSLLKKEPADQPATALIPMVSTVEVSSYSGELDMVVSGTVVPYREVTVAAEVAGNVLKKYPEFEAGNFVKKGTKLLEIDPENYQLLLKTNQAEVKQAQKILEETEKEIGGAKQNLKLAQTDYELQDREYRRNARLKGVLSDSEIDVAKRNLLNAQTQLQGRKNTLGLLEARLERMKASLDLSKSTLARTELDIAKSTIYAPDDGVIVRELSLIHI